MYIINKNNHYFNAEKIYVPHLHGCTIFSTKLDMVKHLVDNIGYNLDDVINSELKLTKRDGSCWAENDDISISSDENQSVSDFISDFQL